MSVLVLNKNWAAKVLAEREAAGEATRDEVWDGVTVIMPEANIEHDDTAGFFYRTFWTVFGTNPANRIHYRVNVSDRVVDWTKNYRIPDTMVFLEGNSARACGTHYCGGPDIALEVVSPDDRSRDKLDFFSKIGTRVVLILDRDPWQLELYELEGGRLRLIGSIEPGDGRTVSSSVVPFRFELSPASPQPKIKIVHTQSLQEWVG
jgi:Uma2 family endonuclease